MLQQKNTFFGGNLFIANLGLPLAYVATTLPLLVFLAVFTPPFQTPDESSHVIRACQFLHHGLCDPVLEEAISFYENIKYKSDVKISQDKERQARALSWSGKLTRITRDNTQAYPFFCYLPQSIGLFIGESLGLHIINSIVLARLFNALTCLCIIFLSFIYIKHARLLFYCILSFPMVLSLFSSCNQEALIIAFSFLTVAMVSHTVAHGPLETIKTRLVFCLSLGLPILARPPLLGMTGLLCLPGLFARSARKNYTVAVLSGAGIVIGLLTWLSLGSLHSAATPGMEHGADAGLQLQFIISHPWTFLKILFSPQLTVFKYIVRQIVGVLGWLDAFFPLSYYLLTCFFILLGLLHTVVSTPKTTRTFRILCLLTGFGTILSMYIAEYIIWSPVGSDIIIGVQGRYLLPMLFILALGIPFLGKNEKIKNMTTVFCLAYPVCNFFFVPWLILFRYYI